jgi:hypothetical protein
MNLRCDVEWCRWRLMQRAQHDNGSLYADDPGKNVLVLYARMYKHPKEDNHPWPSF